MRTTVSLATLLVLGLLADSAQSQCVLNENYPGPGTGGSHNPGSFVLCQSFTPTQSFSLCSVEAHLQTTTGSTLNATLTVQTGPLAGSSILTQTTATLAGNTTAWVVFDVPNIQLTQNTVYYIRVSGGSGSNGLWDHSGGNPYARGAMYLDGSPFGGGNTDLLFRTNGDGVTFPPDLGAVAPMTSVFSQTQAGTRFSISIPANSLRRRPDSALVTHTAVNIPSYPLHPNGPLVVTGGIYNPLSIAGTSDHVSGSKTHTVSAASQATADTRLDLLNATATKFVLNSVISVPMKMNSLAVAGDSAVTLSNGFTYKVQFDQAKTDLDGFPNGTLELTATAATPHTTTGTFHTSFDVRPTITFVPAAPSPGPNTLFFHTPGTITLTSAGTPSFSYDRNAVVPALGFPGMLLAAVALLLAGSLFLVSRRRQKAV